MAGDPLRSKRKVMSGVLFAAFSHSLDSTNKRHIVCFLTADFGLDVPGFRGGRRSFQVCLAIASRVGIMLWLHQFVFMWNGHTCAGCGVVIVGCWTHLALCTRLSLGSRQQSVSALECVLGLCWCIAGCFPRTSIFGRLKSRCKDVFERLSHSLSLKSLTQILSVSWSMS